MEKKIRFGGSLKITYSYIFKIKSVYTINKEMVQIIICMMNLINYPEVRSVGSWLTARSCRMRSELNERCLMLIACLQLFSEY
jgi:hypothetical protein